MVIQDVLFDENDELAEDPVRNTYILILNVESKELMTMRGEVPQGIAVIPELGYAIKPGDIVNYRFERDVNFDLSKIIDTELNEDLCARKEIAMGLRKDAPKKENPTDEIPEDSEEPLPTVDRNDYIQTKLKVAGFELKAGKIEGELSVIAESEEPKAKNVKLSGSKDKKLELELTYAVDKMDFDGIQLDLGAKKGKWGQYEPKLELSIYNVATGSWKLVDGSELFNKGAKISNDLFRNVNDYIVEQGEKKEIRIKLFSDLNKLDQCKFFKLLPCTIQPSILLDYVKVITLEIHINWFKIQDAKEKK